MILLDTNVISEPVRSEPNPAVLDWLDENMPSCALSSIAIFELLNGVALLPEGKRRDLLASSISRAIRRFHGRIYAFDQPAAEAAARLLAAARSAGRGARQLPANLADLQTAGIASANGLSLATRNIADFEAYGIPLIDPWSP